MGFYPFPILDLLSIGLLVQLYLKLAYNGRVFEIIGQFGKKTHLSKNRLIQLGI